MKSFVLQSVDMFSMFVLGRPDILPVGDWAVRKSMERLYGLKVPAHMPTCP